jgi:hypothetical protein
MHAFSRSPTSSFESEEFAMGGNNRLAQLIFGEGEQQISMRLLHNNLYGAAKSAIRNQRKMVARLPAQLVESDHACSSSPMAAHFNGAI